MPKKKVNIYEVARAAGVSATAVSFAFNNPAEIGSDTAERIREAARELGYSPSPLARAMASQKTNVIGLLAPGTIYSAFANPFIAQFLEGVGSVCDEYSYNIQVVSPYKGSLEEATKRAPVDAYIVLGINESHEDIEPLRRRRVPFVVVDGESELVSSINVNNEKGAYTAASYFLSHGHRDFVILVFGMPASNIVRDAHTSTYVQRMNGYQRAFRDYGVEFSFDFVFEGETSLASGGRAFRTAWDSGRRPTALLSFSDVKALGALQEANRLGIRVPDDMEIIGFDNVPQAEFSRPALSTVAQPTVEKGRKAAELLFAELNSDSAVIPTRVVFDTQLILRETTIDKMRSG